MQLMAKALSFLAVVTSEVGYPKYNISHKKLTFSQPSIRDLYKSTNCTRKFKKKKQKYDNTCVFLGCSLKQELINNTKL
jgi:predicted metalloendopeptidase